MWNFEQNAKLTLRMENFYYYSNLLFMLLTEAVVPYATFFSVWSCTNTAP